MDVFGIISIVFNALLGGGMLFQFFTVKALRNKANAEAEGAKATAESTEIGNVKEVIAIWKDMTESLKTELQQSRVKYMEIGDELQKTKNNYIEIGKQVVELKDVVSKLTETIKKIPKMLDKINHDNLEKVVAQIKDEINGKDNNGVG
jgi:predicted  nucleic acid-binding Zn-ribbon protein